MSSSNLLFPSISLFQQKEPTKIPSFVLRVLAILQFPIIDTLKHKVRQDCLCSKYPDNLLIPFLSSN